MSSGNPPTSLPTFRKLTIGSRQQSGVDVMITIFGDFRQISPIFGKNGVFLKINVVI
jgi:hypothetical protein